MESLESSENNLQICSLISKTKQESLALASMARDDAPASSTASSTAPRSSTAAAIRGKSGIGI